MLRDYNADAIGGDQTATLTPTPTKLNPRKSVTKPTHQRRTVTDPAKCVFVLQILAIREAEAAGKRMVAETLKAKLLTMSRGFIRRTASKFYGDDVEQEDADATAMMAFWRAVTTWQPDGGSPFDTWARWGMRMELQKMLRASRMIRGKKQERVSLASVDGDDDVDGDLPPGVRDTVTTTRHRGAAPTIAYLTHRLDREADRTKGQPNERRASIFFKEKFGRWPSRDEMDAAMKLYHTPTDGAA